MYFCEVIIILIILMMVLFIFEWTLVPFSICQGVLKMSLIMSFMFAVQISFKVILTHSKILQKTWTLYPQWQVWNIETLDTTKTSTDYYRRTVIKLINHDWLGFIVQTVGFSPAGSYTHTHKPTTFGCCFYPKHLRVWSVPTSGKQSPSLCWASPHCR